MYLRRLEPVCGFWIYSFECFNSWIIRRSLNHCFPESTVIETYQLHKWAHFLQYSWHVPSNSLFCLEVMEVQEIGNSANHMHAGQLTCTGPPSSLQRCTQAVWCFMLKYAADKKRAEQRHQLQKFLLISSSALQCEQQLASDEVAMCQWMQNLGNFTKNYFFQDIHDRNIIVSTKDSNTQSTSSSHVFMLLEAPHNSFTFRRVELIFKHSFIGKTTTLPVSIGSADHKRNLHQDLHLFSHTMICPFHLLYLSVAFLNLYL